MESRIRVSPEVIFIDRVKVDHYGSSQVSYTSGQYTICTRFVQTAIEEGGPVNVTEMPMHSSKPHKMDPTILGQTEKKKKISDITIP